jgi:hypothetical protein
MIHPHALHSGFTDLLLYPHVYRLLNNRESAKRVRDKREDDSIGYSEKVG